MQGYLMQRLTAWHIQCKSYSFLGDCVWNLFFLGYLIHIWVRASWIGGDGVLKKKEGREQLHTQLAAAHSWQQILAFRVRANKWVPLVFSFIFELGYHVLLIPLWSHQLGRSGKMLFLLDSNFSLRYLDLVRPMFELDFGHSNSWSTINYDNTIVGI